jgi:hypothetical protein
MASRDNNITVHTYEFSCLDEFVRSLNVISAMSNNLIELGVMSTLKSFIGTKGPLLFTIVFTVYD